MSFLGAQVTIETAFLTAWGVTTPVDSENQQFDPQNVDVDEWVRFLVLDAGGKQVAMGTDTALYRYRGIAVVQIFTRPNLGVGRALSLADQVTPIFRSKRIGGVQFDVPVVVRNGTKDGWYQINVDCPFYREEL